MTSSSSITLQFPAYAGSVPTLPALRNLSVAGRAKDEVILVTGAAQSGDGYGGAYTWNPTSLDTDDNATVIKPISISGAGRWKRSFGRGADGVNGQGLAEVIAPSGATLVGYKGRSVATKLDEVVSIDDFTGTTVARMKAAAAALAARGGGVLFIPRGSYSLDSAELAQPVTLAANVIVEGNGSTLTVTGTTTTSAIFGATNVSNVTVRNLTAVGNNKADAYTNGVFFSYVMTTNASANCQNVKVEDVSLDNFKGPYWISIAQNSATWRLRNVTVQRINAISQPGNAIDPTLVQWNSSIICVAGTETAYIQNVTVRDIQVFAAHVKSGVILYHSVQEATIENVVVENAGYAGVFTPDAGCYGIQVYDTYGNGRGVNIRNVRVSALSVGIYVAGFQSVHIQNAQLFGITDTADTTLPKAGVVMNGTLDWTIRDTQIWDSRAGVSVAGSSRAARTNGFIENVIAESGVARPLVVSSWAGSNSPPSPQQPLVGLTIRKSRFVSTATDSRGADFRMGDAAKQAIRELRIEDSRFQGTLYGADFYALAQADTQSADFDITRTSFAAGPDGVALRLRATDALVRISDCHGQTTTTGQQFQLINLTKLRARNLEAIGATGGVGFNFSSSSGTIDGFMRTTGNTSAVLGLGAALPTGAGVKGDFVKAIDFSPPAAGDNQLYVKGWVNVGGSSWRPVSERVDT